MSKQVIQRPNARKWNREEVSQKIFALMREGKSTLKACAEIGISQSTFAEWARENKDLAVEYARAREDLIEFMAQQIIEIADAPVGSTDSGATDTGAVQKQRLQVDARKWLLSKLAPKKYGDKLELSGDANNPIAIAKIERVIVDGQAKRVEDES